MKRITPTWIQFLAAAACFLALLGMPYGFYTLLRWIVTAAAIGSGIDAVRAKSTNLTWAFFLTAFLFNPIIPIHLSRSLWTPVDLAVAGLFTYAALRKR